MIDENLKQDILLFLDSFEGGLLHGFGISKEGALAEILQLIHQRDGELTERLKKERVKLTGAITDPKEILNGGFNQGIDRAIQLVQQQGVTPTEDNCICHCHGFEIDTCFNKTKCKYRKCKHCTPTEEESR